MSPVGVWLLSLGIAVVAFVAGYLAGRVEEDLRWRKRLRYYGNPRGH